MQALQDAAMRRCAGPNGLIDDPPSCRFDPAELACPAGGASCLSPEQVEAARLVYAGPRTSDGRQIFPGFAPGSERGWEQLYAQVSADGSAGGGSWLGFFRYMVLDDPGWTLQQLDFDRDYDRAEQRIGNSLGANDPNLDVFANRGGRIIIYHGWADQQVPPVASLDYRERVKARRADVDGFLRLFMAPGMAHCEPERLTSGVTVGPNLAPVRSEYRSPFTSENDGLTALQAWVEQGRAPDSLVVRVRNDPAGVLETSVRTCPAPQRARWTGTGDPRRAETWQCSSS
jgi:feruloyl esterase